MSFQRIIIEGNMGKDPMPHNFENGNNIATFSLAVSEKGYTTRSGMQVPEHTEWFSVVVRGNTANTICQYAKKGDRILVEGKLRTRTYTNAQTNTQSSVTEVIADNVVFLTPKSPQGHQENNIPNQ